MWNFPIMPEQASEFAPEYDKLFWMTTALTVFFTVLVGAIVIILAVRYRKGNRVNRHNPADTHMTLEVTWSVIPLILGLVMFFWAAKLFVEQRTPPKDAMDLFVIGKQWMWHVQHPNGVRENNTLHVPVGKPVRLTMISQDVIHSFFIPQFRMKQDVLPGRYSVQWFTPTKVGKYNLFCTEYCGTQHSEMGGYVYVMSPADYQAWLASGGDNPPPTRLTPVEEGEKLWDRHSCGSCHTEKDTPRGPSLFGIYGSKRSLEGGGTTVADLAYLRESLLDPYKQLTKGYLRTMPTYKGQLSEEQVLNLIAYMKTLGSAPAPVASNLNVANPASSSTGAGN
jgi:cytochrome c oxidase subunit II